MNKTIAYSCFFLSLLFFVACTNNRGTTIEPIKIQGEAQGTFYSIVYYDTCQRDLTNAIDSLLDDFDLTASLWKENSLISLVNDRKDSVVNELFASLVEFSTSMNAFTNGAFDCTVGALVNAWGFGFSNQADITDNMIDSLLLSVGKQPFITRNDDDRPVVHLPNPNTKIDFNAIAQGYSTDLVASFFNSLGIKDFVVNIGGEVYAQGMKPGGIPWVVGVERPAENKYSPRSIEVSIGVTDCAVVTSGNYRKYYEKDGMRYSHTIDPTTGRPVEHSLLSVTVIDSTAWRADALATAFMVMGLDKALQFVKQHPDDSGTQALFFIYSDKDGYKTYETEAFKKLVVKQ